MRAIVPLPVFCLLATLIAAIVAAAAPSRAAVIVGEKAGSWDTLKLTWSRGDDPDESLANPIGNSHIAAKVRGGVGAETLYLNNKTFWSGWPTEHRSPKRREAMLAARARLAAGDHEGAEQAARGMWGNNAIAGYLPLGNLLVEFDHGAAHTAYVRELDLDRALSIVRYTVGQVTYTREAFASHPDRIIVMRLTASEPGKVSFTTRLQNPVEMGEHGAVGVEDGHTLVMRGRAPSSDHKTWDPEKGMKHETRVRVLPQGGRLSAGSAPGTLRVEAADAVVFHIADATSYNGHDKEPGTAGVDPAPRVKADLHQVVAKSYDQLLDAHVADYRPLLRRLWVQLNGDPVDKHALTYQFMRYSMIAVSRSGDVPHNLLGVWSHRWNASSKAQFFLNENVQKYYGLIETGNLAETGDPLWVWMAHLASSGTRTAHADWGFNGWTTGHCSDLWVDTTLRGSNNEWAIWPSGGMWLCQNLWDHYAFGLDEAFLRDRAYPIMKGAAEFALDYLVEDPDGMLVTSPSTSPENRFALEDGGRALAVTTGSTIDMGLIRELFENLIEASRVLGIDPEFRARLEATLPRLKPYQVSRRDSSRGELQEWAADHSRVPEDTRKRFTPHRHTSHLVTVWPLRQITERKTPELFAAAKLALTNRGRGGYHPDKAAMWARLKEGDKALEAIGRSSHKTAGTFPPLYSAFAEMLLQSHTGEIELLPALPTTWSRGHIDGLRARGGYEVALRWDAGKLTEATIRSTGGTRATVRYGDRLIELNLTSGQTVRLNPSMQVVN